MPKFFYIARDPSGEKIFGQEEAISQDECISHLQARDLIVISITTDSKDTKIAKPEGVRRVRRYRHLGVTSDDLVLFCRQLATLLGAGVTILKSLDVIAQQVASRRLYNVIRSLQKSMEEGQSLYEAMSKHHPVFSELWVNLVESGEASGNLAMILNRLASYLERQASFRRRIINAMIYPLILMVAATTALLFMTVRIIPVYADLFKSFDVQLPTLTKILIGVSYFVRNYIFIILGAAIGSFFIVRKYIRTKNGRRRYERFKFRIPIFGEFFRSLIVERFSAEMSTLIESGVPILYSLEIIEHSLGNLVVGDIIGQVKEDVRQGKSISQPMEKSGFFEPMVVQMVTIGEEIGELSQMFKRINSFYEEHVETFLNRFATMFEPFMLLVMGVIIGILVIGMFLPIFQLTKII